MMLSVIEFVILRKEEEKEILTKFVPDLVIHMLRTAERKIYSILKDVIRKGLIARKELKRAHNENKENKENEESQLDNHIQTSSPKIVLIPYILLRLIGSK
jgi:hypothetical protein